MLLIEPWGGCCCDEELGSVRARTSIGQTDSIWSINCISSRSPRFHSVLRGLPIMFEVIRELVLKFPTPNTRASSSIAKRVSRLDHKLGNDTMEYDAFIISTARMPNKILHGFRGLLGEQPEMDVTQCCVDGGSVGYAGRSCGRCGGR